MSHFHVEVRIKPRAGLLDPEGKAIQHALDSLGFEGVDNVRVGKVVDLEVEAPSEKEAIDRATQMCRKLLANPVTEDFGITVSEPTSAGGSEA